MLKYAILYAVLLLMPAVSNAEAIKLSLKETVNMALANNSQIKSSRYNSNAAQQAVDSANSRYLPLISLEETLVATNSPTNAFIMKLDEGRFSPADFSTADAVNNPATRHDFKTALSIQQPLFVPSISPLKELALKESQKAELGLEATRQRIAFQVFQTYLEVQKCDAQLLAADKGIADARENLRLATVRTASGIGLKSDELRARSYLSQVEQQLITARNNLVLARMRLALLIGESEESHFDIIPLHDPVSSAVINEQAIGDALESRVELQISRTELDKADSQLKLAKSEFLPTAGVFASYQLNAKDTPFSSDNDAWTAGVSLKWNIFDGFRRYSERKRALDGQSAAREMFNQASKDVKYQIKESYLRRDEAGKRLEVARFAMADAEETVRLITRRYENSLATMLELLDAQTVLNQARASLAEVEASYALAGGQVYYMAGTFVKEILK